MINEPPPIMSDIFSINVNTIVKILLYQFHCVYSNRILPLLQLPLGPYDWQDAATDLVGVFGHVESA